MQCDAHSCNQCDGRNGCRKPNIHVLTQQVVSYSGQVCIVTFVLIVSCLANLELTPQGAVPHNPAAQIPSASVSALSEGSPVMPTQRIWKGASAHLHSDSEHTGGWGRSPDLGVGWKRISDASAVTEVHLRRLDSTDTLHRRVVAVLTVDATPEEASPCPVQHNVCCLSEASCSKGCEWF